MFELRASDLSPGFADLDDVIRFDPTLRSRSARRGADRPVAFASGGISPAAQVETARGLMAARDLRAGDRVITRDHGLQELLWTGAVAVGKDGAAVRLSQAADAPALTVAPGQGVLACSGQNELLFATDEVVGAARDLVHIQGITAQSMAPANWQHLLFDGQELFRANGLWVTSFVPDAEALRDNFPEEWAEIRSRHPRLQFAAAQAAYCAPRLVLNTREASLINSL